jgi:hypothetical protein
MTVVRHPNDITLDQWDYSRFLVEYRLTEDVVQQLMAANAELPMQFDLLRLEASPIHGLGFFARRQLPGYIAVAQARIGSIRTTAGRYLNHSYDPNAVFVLHPNGDLYAVSRRTIMEGEEVTVDYRQAARHVTGILPPDPAEQYITSLGPQST